MAGPVTTAIAAVQAAITAASPLQNASPNKLAPVKVALDAALTTLDTVAAAIEAAIDESSVGGVTEGGQPMQLITAFQAQSLAVQQLAWLMAARGYLARVAQNIRYAPG
jgi:hypothetical protein